VTRKTNIACAFASAIAAAILAPSSAEAQCGFEFSPVLLPGCDHGPAFLSAINNSGIAIGSNVGCNAGAQKAVKWSFAGGLTTLPIPLPESKAQGINEKGTIVGRGWPQGGGHPSDGWILKNGVYTVIPRPPNSELDATGVLEDDTVFGHYYESEYPWVRPFLWKDGAFLPVPEVLTKVDVIPRGASRGRGGHPGYIVGQIAVPATIPGWGNFAAFRWDVTTGEVVILEVELPHFRAEGIAATPDGRIFGRCETVAEFQGQITTRYRTLEQTPTGVLILDPIPINDGIDFRDVNDQGHALGTSRCQSSGVCMCDGVPCFPWFKNRAVLWRHGALIDVLAIALEQYGLSVTIGGTAINDYGEMVVESGSGGASTFFVRSLKPPGDVDFDCAVGRSDLMLVIENWGQRSDASVAASDLDRDGTIGPYDLAVVLGGWTAK